MKNLLLLTFIILSILSCNGNKTKSDTLKASVEKFKDSLGTLENITYFPETYSETETDTILSNGFRVKIKTFTDMKHSVLNTFKQDSIVYKHYYRELASQIVIKKNYAKATEFFIDKDFIKRNDTSFEFNKEFYETATYHSIWISEFNSTISNKVFLIVSVCKPESDDCLMFKITIDEKGDYKVDEFEHEEIL